jgi:PTH1 family peptidyl-tRNA hydrolase
MIIIGLGNTGEIFKDTRHNVGFEVLDKIKEKNDFPDFTFSKRFHAEISKGTISGKKITLAKPHTFMNLSGDVPRIFMTYYNLEASDFIVIHDDIDILLGQYKISKSKGSAGHKGVQSLINAMKTKNFKRIRIGILPKKGKPKKTERFVLKKFTKKEKEIIKEAVKKIVEEISQIIKTIPKHEIGNS